MWPHNSGRILLYLDGQWLGSEGGQWRKGSHRWGARPLAQRTNPMGWSWGIDDTIPVQAAPRIIACRPRAGRRRSVEVDAGQKRARPALYFQLARGAVDAEAEGFTRRDDSQSFVVQCRTGAARSPINGGTVCYVPTVHPATLPGTFLPCPSPGALE